jgi:branched-chain amino acid aminotransferase
MLPWAVVDGVATRNTSVSMMDLGLLRGFACFDFFRVVDGIPLFFDDHAERLRRSCTLLGLNTAHAEPGQLREWVARLLEANGCAAQGTRCGVRVVVTGGVSPDGWTHDATADTAMLMCHLMTGMNRTIQPSARLLCFAQERQTPHLKSTDYGYALAQQGRLREAGCCELLLVGRDGQLSECSRSSLFFVDHSGQLHTTPDDAVLLGVTRKRILQLCASSNVATHIRPIAKTELASFAGCFIASTSKLILPIEAILPCDAREERIVYKETPSVVVQLYNLLVAQIDEQLEMCKEK